MQFHDTAIHGRGETQELRGNRARWLKSVKLLNKIFDGRSSHVRTRQCHSRRYTGKERRKSSHILGRFLCFRQRVAQSGTETFVTGISQVSRGPARILNAGEAREMRNFKGRLRPPHKSCICNSKNARTSRII